MLRRCRFYHGIPCRNSIFLSNLYMDVAHCPTSDLEEVCPVGCSYRSQRTSFHVGQEKVGPKNITFPPQDNIFQGTKIADIPTLGITFWLLFKQKLSNKLTVCLPRVRHPPGLLVLLRDHHPQTFCAGPLRICVGRDLGKPCCRTRTLSMRLMARCFDSDSMTHFFCDFP